MTELLYLPDDDYDKQFTATVESVGRDESGYVVLDQTLFYPEGGGQPADKGVMRWDGGEASVIDVQKAHGEVRHLVEGDVPEESQVVKGVVDWDRRYEHMRMHTAQHILSWVVLEEYGATTAGNQIHADYSRIDFEPVTFSDDDLKKIQVRANEVIREENSVKKEEMARDDVERRVEDGRTNLDLIPSSVDPLRVVIIGGDDLCPCGGTHVDSTEEVGEVSITDCVNNGAETERLKFTLSPLG